MGRLSMILPMQVPGIATSSRGMLAMKSPPDVRDVIQLIGGNTGPMVIETNMGQRDIPPVASK
jgi:hypothetical protein